MNAERQDPIGINPGRSTVSRGCLGLGSIALLSTLGVEFGSVGLSGAAGIQRVLILSAKWSSARLHEYDFLAGAVIKLRRARALLRRHHLGIFGGALTSRYALISRSRRGRSACGIRPFRYSRQRYIMLKLETSPCAASGQLRGRV